jgi:para-nitrobenzyl esterase
MACHCAELPFTFGTLDAFAGAGMLEGGDRGLEAALSARMRADWIAFIRTGAPGPAWPRYDARRLAMRFNDICEPAAEGPAP